MSLIDEMKLIHKLGGYDPQATGRRQPLTVREEILQEAAEIVTKDRNSAYGDPEDNFKDVADFWNIYLGDRLSRPIEPHDVATMAVLIKIARIRTSPGVRDHWLDVAGYAACGAETLIR